MVELGFSGLRSYLRMCVDKKRNRIGRTLILLAAGAIVAGVMAASANAQSRSEERRVGKEC